MEHRILVVDDNRDAADSLARLLNTLGCETKAVYRGQDAIEQVATFQPDMAFIDIGMPELDGYATVARMRQQRGVLHVILVALTGYSRQEDKQKAYECGFDLHVAKPMSIETLHELLGLLDPVSTD